MSAVHKVEQDDGGDTNTDTTDDETSLLAHATDNNERNPRTSSGAHASIVASPVFAALLYAVCSASMNFANKAVFVNFNFQTTTLLFQMLFTIGVRASDV